MASKKSFRFEVDQSIRIEDISQDTVIGVANKQQNFALVIPKKIKRHFREDFRRQGLPRQFGPLIFCVGIILLLRQFKLRPGSLIVDKEYASHENLITSFLESFYPQTIISIKGIGKSSPAHKAAYWTHRGRRKADAKATEDDLHAILNTKTAGEWHHLEFTRIHLSNRPVKKKHTKKR